MAPRQLDIDPWKPILVCTACGAAQYPQTYPSITHTHYCYACGSPKNTIIGIGTKLHAYTALRMRMEAPLTAAMLMLRREEEGTPIRQKDAVEVAQGGSRFTVMRARTALENQYRAMKRMRVVEQSEKEPRNDES